MKRSNDDDDDNDNDDNLNEKLNDKDIKKRTCLCCLKEVEGSMRCSKCRTALYCGRACQEKHWPVHKHNCNDSNSDNSIEKLEMKARNHSHQGKLLHINQTTIIINIVICRKLCQG